MISTKKNLSTQERKEKISNLRQMHQDYFSDNNLGDALYVPKMAYRPQGKDELHVSFFPSELEHEQDLYTEFVSINYDSEDPKRTLYKHKFNPHWREEYELIESQSGFQRHIIPVSELKVVSDINYKSQAFDYNKTFDIPNPDEVLSHRTAIEALLSIAETLKKIENKLK